MSPADLDKIRGALAVADRLFNSHDTAKLDIAWVRLYHNHVPLLLAELDRLRERVVELKARLDWNFDHSSD